MVKVFLIVVMNRMPQAEVDQADPGNYFDKSIQSAAHHEMSALQPTTQCGKPRALHINTAWNTASSPGCGGVTTWLQRPSECFRLSPPLGRME